MRARKSGSGLAIILSISCVAALIGCRAIVGIEPTELDEAGAGDDGGSDGSHADGQAKDGGGGGTDASSGQDTGCTGSGGACTKCCRDNAGPNGGKLENAMRQTGCLCGSGACQSECATSSCASSPTPPDPGSCVPCEDNLIHGNTCASAFTQCQNDQACASFLTCMKACLQ